MQEGVWRPSVGSLQTHPAAWNSAWEHVGVWTSSSSTSVLFFLTSPGDTHTHTHTHTHTQSQCNNSTLFIITGPSTVAVLTKPLWVVLDRGVSDFPEASAAGGCIPVISTCSVMYMTVVKTGRVSDLWWLIDGTLMPFVLARTEKVVSEFYWQKHNYCLIVWVTFWSDLIWKSVRVTLQTCSCKLMKWFCVRNHFFFLSSTFEIFRKRELFAQLRLQRCSH